MRKKETICIWWLVLSSHALDKFITLLSLVKLASSAAHRKHLLSFSGHTCGLAITLTKWNDGMEVNGWMTCKPKLPLSFSSHDDLRYSVSPGSCHPLWHRSHRRKSHIWHRRSHGLCDRPWRTLYIHLPHLPSYRCDSGTWRVKRTLFLSVLKKRVNLKLIFMIIMK